MKIKINKACIVLIYILTFVSALTYLRHTTTDVYAWRILYLCSVLGINVLCIVYEICRRTIIFDRFTLLLAVIVILELCVSCFSGLFVVPMILVDVIAWPMMLSVYYDYSKENQVPEVFKGITLIGMVLVCLFAIPALRMRFSGNGNAAVYATYYCMTFLPMIFMFYENKIIMLFSGIVSIMMLLTSKRAALLIIMTGLLLYYMVSISNQDNSRKKIRRAALFAFGIIVFAFIGQYLIEKLHLNILQRLAQMLDDGGSGRIRIWAQVMDYFRSSSSIEKWFGHGFHSVFYEVRPLGIARYAHNSFLETLYDYGYVGLLLIICVVLRIILDTIRMIRHHDVYAPLMAYSLAPMLILGLVSYIFEQSVVILPLSVLWGICMGSYYRKSSKRRFCE